MVAGVIDVAYHPICGAVRMTHFTGISVVIPAFNRLDLLIRAIDSVDSDDVEHTEIIVVDDCSPQIISAGLAGRNVNGIAIRMFRLQRNGGPQAARNFGIRRAHFSHIALLDSDETFLVGKLAAVRSEIICHDPDIIFHAERGVSGYNFIGRSWWLYVRSVVPFHWFITLINPVGTSSFVFARNGRLGAPSLRYTEDWAFLLHYTRPGMIVRYLTEEFSKVHRVRGSEGGVSAQRWRMRKGEFMARSMLLRHGSAGDYLRYILGTAVGGVRLLNDLVRLRYWR